MTVQNNGSNAAQNVKVNDPPTGFVLVPAQSSSSCVQNGAVVTCTLAALAPNSSVSFLLAFSTQNALCSSNAIDLVTVTADNIDPNLANNQTTFTTFVSCVNVPQCSDSIDNDGDGAVDYPADFSCTDASDNDESFPKAQCQDGTDNDGDGLVDYPNDPGCTSRNDNDESDSSSVTCKNGDLDIQIDPRENNVHPNDDLDYDITVTNSGNTACTVDLTARLDNDTNFRFASSGGDEDGSETVRWNDLVINRDDQRSVKLTVRVNNNVQPGQVLTLKASVPGASDTANVYVGNGSVIPVGPVVPVTGQGQVKISKYADRSTAQAGDTVNYMLTVQNLGSGPATNVVINDTYTSGQLAILDAAGGQVNGAQIQWNLGTLDANVTRTIRYTARIGSGMQNGDIVDNDAVVTSSAGTSSDTSLIRVISQLPQTGIGLFNSQGDDTWLSPMHAVTATSGAVALAGILSTMLSGLGAGAWVGRKFFI